MPPAVGPTCESVWIPAPDNRCAASFIQTHGTGRDASASARIECSYEQGGFSEEIIRIFADRPIPLRWLDDTTLEISLSPDAHFTPPHESAGLPTHTIRYKYQVVKNLDTSGLQCFEQRQLRPGDFKLLSGAEKRPAHAPGWITYGTPDKCMLVGQSVASTPEKDLISYQFTRDATATLPFGTTDLVFMVDAWRRSASQRFAPEIRLSSGGAPLMPQPNGPGRGFRLTGASAERLMKQLIDGVPVALSYKDGATGTLAIDISQENFPSAHAAFQTCTSAFGH
jgi:hypothetical protein